MSTPLGRFEVGVASPALVAPTWPDWAAKGELLLAPATVVGDIRVLGDDGALVAVYAVPARLVFLDCPPEVTYPLADLQALLAPLGDVVAVGSGEVLADIGPGAVTVALVAAEVAP